MISPEEYIEQRLKKIQPQEIAFPNNNRAKNHIAAVIAEGKSAHTFTASHAAMVACECTGPTVARRKIVSENICA
jgi:hypothetical protein